MAIDINPEASDGVSLTRRFARGRAVLAAAAVVFAVLALTGLLSPLPAGIGLSVIALAALLGIPTDAGAISGAGGRDARTLSATDRLINGVIAGLPEPVIVLDRQEIVVAFNAKAQAVAPALSSGEPISFALRIPDVVEAIRRTAATGQEERVEFFERVPADRWSEAFIVPVTLATEAGDRRLLFLSLHDLTPLRRVEEMRADFVANASHELRTPLASLAGFIETLQGSARDDPQARERFLDIMKTQAMRMARLIDDLLSLSRIELKAHVQPQTTVDLAAIVRQVADGLQMLARERGVEIKIDMPEQPLIVRGDRDELIRVFENLIENALKYGAVGKRVEVSGAREEAANRTMEAAITVRDFGPGIAPEHLPRLTERFYRVDVVESRAQGGTGLGLALVKHILNRHRGRLTIDSVPGTGAAFTVRLPAVADIGKADNSSGKATG